MTPGGNHTLNGTLGFLRLPVGTAWLDPVGSCVSHLDEGILLKGKFLYISIWGIYNNCGYSVRLGRTNFALTAFISKI